MSSRVPDPIVLGGEGEMAPGAIEVNADHGGEPAASRGVIRAVGETFLEHRLAVVGLALITFMLLFSFVGPLFYHTVQNRPNLNTETLRPSAAHILGTDDQGYDELGRLMLGGQSSLEVGCAAALLATIWGTAWGAVAGYFGGWIDSIMMRIVDSVMAIPYLLLIMLLTTIFRPTVLVLILIIGAVSWLGTARLVRGDTLSIRVRDYVQASKGVGLRSERIILRHIVPNVIGTVAVAATFSVADSILLLASLSFLGLGPPPPAANWGASLSEGLNYIYDGYWWVIYPPGVAIVMTVAAFNFVGDGLRDALEVRLRAH